MSIAIVNNRISGTRITIYDVYQYVEAGRSPERIAEILRLTREQIDAALEYIDAHQAEVKEEHRRIEERIAQGNPPEIEALGREAHARLLALRDELRRRKTPGVNGAGNSGGC